MTRLALIGGGENAAFFTTVVPRLPNLEFVAVVNPVPNTAKHMAVSLDASITANSLDGLLDQHLDTFDAVLILESSSSRASLAIRSAEAGKHVLVASPFAPSAKAAEDIISACRSANVKLMVGHSLRFMPSQQEVKSALTDGKLGEPGLLRIHRWAESTDQSNTDDIVMNQTVDGIDLAIWLFDGMPTEVYAISRPSYVQVHLGFADGGMALIDDARTLPSGDGYFSLSLIGSTGAAYADDHHNRNLLFRGGDPNAIDTGQGSLHLTAQLREFIAAIEEQREPVANGTDGQVALQVAEAAVSSLQSRQALRMIGGSYELV
ncbi:MAG: Gfo/Idh/MocA family oxidoreductase [Candidatus Poribacteria bacterium]|nr:Gfo/Idh/MocA family oxidoreductase [Candidatus Poribacteria bacterium]MDP6962288.1 Gfo/Idh/MocA family oxidoreductase [Dehalococcoidia bacterium]